MDSELRHTLCDLLRVTGEYDNMTDDEVMEESHRKFMNIKLVEPLHWSSGWRKSCQHMRGHILENEDDTFNFDTFLDEED